MEEPGNCGTSCINCGTSCINGASCRCINGGKFELKLAPGYRFMPHDSELLVHYLKRKVEGKPLPVNCIQEVKINLYDPDLLLDIFKPNDGTVMYFFTPRDRKYKRGSRPDRAVEGGYWKASGKDTTIVFKGKEVGFKKTLVFYRGQQKKGKKTSWHMHEFRLNNPPLPQGSGENGMKLDDYVLCKIYKYEKNNKINAENQIVDEANEEADGGNYKAGEANEEADGGNNGEMPGRVNDTNMHMMMGYNVNQLINVGNDFHAYRNPAGFFYDNLLSHRYAQVPQTHSGNVPQSHSDNNGFEYSAKMSQPLSSIKSDWTIEQQDFGAQVLHGYHFLEDQKYPIDANELDQFYSLPEQFDFPMFDKDDVKGEECSFFNDEEAYGVQDLPPLNHYVINQSQSPDLDEFSALDEFQVSGEEGSKEKSDPLLYRGKI